MFWSGLSRHFKIILATEKKIWKKWSTSSQEHLVGLFSGAHLIFLTVSLSVIYNFDLSSFSKLIISEISQVNLFCCYYSWTLEQQRPDGARASSWTQLQKWQQRCQSHYSFHVQWLFQKKAFSKHRKGHGNRWQSK